MKINKTLPTHPAHPEMPTVLHSFGDRFGYSGIGTTAYQLANGAAALGCRLLLTSPSFDKIPDNRIKTLSTVTLFGHRIPFKLLGRQFGKKIHDLRTAKFLKQNGKHIDILHCWSGTALNTLKAARQHNIFSFLHRSNTHTAFAYEMARKEHQRLGINMPPKYFFTPNNDQLKMEEEEYQLADRILAPSEFVARTFLERGFSREKIALIQYGYDPDIFYLPSKAVLKKPSHTFTAAFVGRGEPRKGLHHALKAWIESGLCQRGRLVLAGDMHFLPEYRKKLENWLSHPSITELGVVNDVAAVLRNADVLVLPTLEEGSAKVTYEARACGCVLVVSDHSGAQCSHMENGLVHEAGDVATLQQHLLMLEKKPTLYEQLKTASTRDLDKLTWAYAAKRLMGVYQKALKDAERQIKG